MPSTTTDIQALPPMEAYLATLVAQRLECAPEVVRRSPDVPLSRLGLDAIELCDLTVGIEDRYGIAYDVAPDTLGGWSVRELAGDLRRRLRQGTEAKPNWKDSFENIVFSGTLTHLRTPLSLHLDATFRCNMRCVFCYDSSGHNRLPEELSTAEVQGIIDQARDLDMVDITWGGGEPFMRPDFMDLLRHTRERGLRSFILTNGTFITADIARRLARMLDWRFDMLQVSLDGPTAAVHDRQRGVPGAFERTLQGLRHLLAAGVQPTVNSVLTRHNAAAIPQMIDFLIDLGVVSYRALRLHPLGRGRDMGFYREWVQPDDEAEATARYLDRRREELVGHFSISDDQSCLFPWSRESYRRTLPYTPGREPRSYACAAGTTRISMAADGSVFPCSYLYDFPEMKKGSLRDSTIMELWEDPELWREYREPLEPQGKCRHCEYLSTCRTGCRAVAYAMHGHVAAPDAGCSYQPGQDRSRERSLAGAERMTP